MSIRLDNETQKEKPDDRKGDVLPGIIATVTDQNKNEIFLDLDLELEPIDEQAGDKPSDAPQEDIAPGLASAMAGQQQKAGFSFLKKINFPKLNFPEFSFLKTFLEKLTFTKRTYALAGICLFLGICLPVIYLLSSGSVTPVQQITAEVRQISEMLPPPAPEQQAAPAEAVVQEQPSPMADDAEGLALTRKQEQKEPAVAPGDAAESKEPAAQSLKAEAKEKGGEKEAVQSTVVAEPPQPAAPQAEAQEQARESADYYFYSGYACEKKRDYAGALTWYKKAIELDTEGCRLPNKIAYVLMQMSLYEDAERYVQKALSTRRDYLPALTNMGIICAKRDKYDEAEKYLSEALALDSTNTGALYNMMLVYRKQQKFIPANEIEAKLKTLGVSGR